LICAISLVLPDAHETQRTNPDLLAGRVDHRLGDRVTGGYRSIDVHESWDAAVDVCAYVPRHVHQLADVVGGRAGQYVQVSSVSTPAGCAASKFGHDVGGAPVDRLASAVVTYRRARVGTTGGLLDVAKRDASVQGAGDEGMTQGVRSDLLTIPDRRGVADFGAAAVTRRGIHRPGGCRGCEAAGDGSDRHRAPLRRGLAGQ